MSFRGGEKTEGGAALLQKGAPPSEPFQPQKGAPPSIFSSFLKKRTSNSQERGADDAGVVAQLCDHNAGGGHEAAAVLLYVHQRHQGL